MAIRIPLPKLHTPLEAEVKTLRMELDAAKARMRFLNERIDMLENRFEVAEENERCERRQPEQFEDGRV